MSEPVASLTEARLLAEVVSHFPEFTARKLKRWRAKFPWLGATRNRGGNRGSNPSTYSPTIVKRLLRTIDLSHQPGHEDFAELRIVSWLVADECSPEENVRMVNDYIAAYTKDVEQSKYRDAIVSPVDPECDKVERVEIMLDETLENEVPAKQRSTVEAIANAVLLADTEIHERAADPLDEADPLEQADLLYEKRLALLRGSIPFPKDMRPLSLIERIPSLSDVDIERARRFIGQIFTALNASRLANLHSVDGASGEWPSYDIEPGQFAVNEKTLVDIVFKSWPRVLKFDVVPIIIVYAELSRDFADLPTIIERFLGLFGTDHPVAEIASLVPAKSRPGLSRSLPPVERVL